MSRPSRDYVTAFLFASYLLSDLLTYNISLFMQNFVLFILVYNMLYLFHCFVYTAAIIICPIAYAYIAWDRL